MDKQLKIAVFIDFDNIEIGVKSTLQREFDVAVGAGGPEGTGRDRDQDRLRELGTAGYAHARAF